MPFIFPEAFRLRPVRASIRIGGIVLLAIYGNSSANKMPRSGCFVLLNYEFYCRYLDELAEFLTSSDDNTLLAANTQPMCC